ncbi:MAG: PilZ domain-containing protein [Gammaproteobacteria bacterium]|nr:PilZ domain-containing protein [Gammaproteobacteria bacterium]
MLERRWNPRKEFEVHVAIYYSGLGILRGVSRDISLKGMFIKLPSVQLPLNAALDVVFSLGSQKDRQRMRVPALVVRSESDGVGAMFSNLELSASAALCKMMNQSPAMEVQSHQAAATPAHG